MRCDVGHVPSRVPPYARLGRARARGAGVYVLMVDVRLADIGMVAFVQHVRVGALGIGRCCPLCRVQKPMLDACQLHHQRLLAVGPILVLLRVPSQIRRRANLPFLLRRF